MNQINLREAPLVDKPEDGATLFALNQDGTINRIKADGVGGGKVAKMTTNMSSYFGESNVSLMSLQNRNGGVSTLSNVNNNVKTIIATCENMTFAEAVEIIKAGNKLDVMLTYDVDGMGTGAYATGYAVSYMYAPEQSNINEKIWLAVHEPYYDCNMYWEWTEDDGIVCTI